MNIFKLLLHLFLFFPNAVSTSFHIENLQFRYHLSNQDDFKQFHTAPNCFNPPSEFILKKHLSTLYTQMTQEKKADPQLTKLILFNILQIFQINKIKFQQYLILHKHPDIFIHNCDATTQTDYTIIRPKAFSKNLSKRTRTSLEKKLVSYWPWDDNDSTDDELQKDPPEATLDENSPHKTYTYITFSSSPKITTALAYSPSSTVWTHWSPPINTKEIAVAAKIQHHSALTIPNCRL